MNKLSPLCLSIIFFSSTALADVKHVGGNVINVSNYNYVKSTPVYTKVSEKTNKTNFGQRSLFDYGVNEKGISKSEKEYREFLAAGSYSRSRSIGGNSYANVGAGSYGGGGARAIYSGGSSAGRGNNGGYASLGNRNNRGFASLGGRTNGGFATLGRNR